LTPALWFLRLFAVLVIGCSVGAAAGEESGGIGDAHLRLLTPLSSITSMPDTEFRAVVIAPLEHAGRVLMPPGTLVYGTIISRKSVGLGLLHERASLALSFREYALPDGRRFLLKARLHRVENGREYVTPNGLLKGVLAADSPQAIIGGVWTRPTLTLFQRATVGLTGASGRIWKSYSLGPFGAAGLFAVHCALFRMPEPDIQLPAGTELSLTVLAIPEDAPDFDIPDPSPFPFDLEEFLKNQPFVVTQANGSAANDIVNVAFKGSAADLLTAFRAAGWILAAPLTPQSFTREYTAFTAKRGYSDAPASRLMYRGMPPAFVFEKSLNSITMRHHVRIWRVSGQGHEELWLGAATHDVGLGFDGRAMKFKHRIQAHIDGERAKIVNDLNFSGCSEPAGFVERPEAVQSRFEGAGIDTDGRIAFLQLRSCPPVGELAVMDRPRPVGPVIARIARRLVLEARQYVERENTFFWTYRAVKWTRAARKGSVEDDDN
jgi:hypothetical protein